MRGWTTSDLKKKNKFNKNVSVKDLLQLFAVYVCLYIYMYMYICICKKAHDFRDLSNCIFNDYP